MGALVAIVTVTVSAVPLSCTAEFDSLQVGAGVAAGVTLQLRFTVPAKAPAGAIARLNRAFCPAGTVCEACDPESNPIVKSGAATPIPESVIVRGLPPPLCAMVILPVRFPTADGANVTEIWQLLPMANDVPQVFVCAKSPEAEIPVIFSGAFPMLVRVEVCAALVASTVSEANVSVVGLRLTAAPTAIPTNSTDSGLPGSVPLIAILAILDPPDVGVNVTLTVQLPPGAREPPQLLVSAKSELSVPARLIPVMFNPEFPVLTTAKARIPSHS